MMSYKQRSHNDSGCILRRITVDKCNRHPRNLCPFSHHSNLPHHLWFLSLAPWRTQSTSMRDWGNPLSKYRTTPNQLLARKVMRNSPSGAGQALQLSTTGRGGSTGTPWDSVETMAQSAMVHGGVEKAWHTIPRWGFGTQTNLEIFELAGGQCYEFHQFSGPFFVFSMHLTHHFHCFICCTSYLLFSLFQPLFRLDWCCALMAALVDIQHNFHQLHAACRHAIALLCTAFLPTFYYLNTRTT